VVNGEKAAQAAASPVRKAIEAHRAPSPGLRVAKAALAASAVATPALHAKAAIQGHPAARVDSAEAMIAPARHVRPPAADLAAHRAPSPGLPAAKADSAGAKNVRAPRVPAAAEDLPVAGAVAHDQAGPGRADPDPAERAGLAATGPAAAGPVDAPAAGQVAAGTGVSSKHQTAGAHPAVFFFHCARKSPHPLRYFSE
jgi:hypothetical protein